MPNSLKFRSLAGINRKAMATLPRSLKIDTRNRPWSPKAKPKSAPHFLELLLAPLGRDALHQRHRVFRRQNLRLQRNQMAVVADHRRLADGNVRSLALRLTTVCSSLS